MVVKNGRIVDAGTDRIADLRIKGLHIEEIADRIDPDEGEEVIDASGMIVMPGAIDLSVRVRSTRPRPLMRRLAPLRAGGITRAAVIPVGRQGVDTAETITAVRADHQEGEVAIEFLADTIRHDEPRLAELATLCGAGAAGVAVSTEYDGNTLYRAAQYAAGQGKTLFVTCRNPSLEGPGVMHEGDVSARHGLVGLPAFAETAEAVRAVVMAEAAGVPVVIRHVSAASTIRAVRKLATAGRTVFEIGLPHLLFSDTVCEGFDTRGKIFPPLRGDADGDALLEAVGSDDMVFISSHDADFSDTDKNEPFDTAAEGMRSGHLFIPLLYTRLACERGISLSRISACISAVPATVTGRKDVGLIAKGYRADLVVYDPSETRQIDDPASPYHGMRLQGRVMRCMIGGSAE